MRNARRHRYSAAPRRQRGAAMILVVVGMVAILGIAGLALDSGHMMLNKTRLQNSADAAALAAAKTLDQTADVTLAEAAAEAMFAVNAGNAGNREIGDAYASGDIDVTVEFSSTLNPFTPGSVPPAYVRVRALGFTMPAWFSVVVGVTSKRAAASAVAGPSPTINQACNIMPMMVCGDAAAGPPFFGYAAGRARGVEVEHQQRRLGGRPRQLSAHPPRRRARRRRSPRSHGRRLRRLHDDGRHTSKPSPATPSVPSCRASTRASAATWGRCRRPCKPLIRRTSSSQQPAPPTRLRSRHRHDHASRAAGHRRRGHQLQLRRLLGARRRRELRPPALADGIGAFQRREAAIAIGDCDGTTNGQGEVPLLGFGCFFLLQEAEQQGNESYIYGQFLEDCRAGGMPGPEPTTIPGPYIIQLYRDYCEHRLVSAAMSTPANRRATRRRDGRIHDRAARAAACCCSASRSSAARSCATTR